MDIWSILPAWIALGISLVVLWFQLRPYFSRLQMDVSYIHVAQVIDNTYLLYLRLSVVNNSSRGRVVYNILPESRTQNVIVEKVPWEFDLSSQTASYKSSRSDATPQMKVPISELILLPLDVSPRQSLSKWVGLILTFPPQQPLPQDFVVHLYFEGVDFVGKRMVGCPVAFYPMRLKANRTYDFLRSRFPPMKKIADLFTNEYFLLFLLIAVLILLLIFTHRPVQIIPLE
jgi:hypothetical protein